jgi:hypothetical protein
MTVYIKYDEAYLLSFGFRDLVTESYGEIDVKKEKTWINLALSLELQDDANTEFVFYMFRVSGMAEL